MTLLLAFLFFGFAQAGTLTKCQDVAPATTVTASFTPANEEYVFLDILSTAAPNVTGAKGAIYWDSTMIDAWAGDKVVTYPGNQPAFIFIGDGVKKLELKLENTTSSTTYRICGVLVCRSNLE